MIRVEIINADGAMLRRTYSDDNRYVVRQDGVVYCEAVDPMDSDRTYTEGEQMPPEDDAQQDGSTPLE